MRILGAAVDRPGVTVARLCEPWCCQVTQSEYGDIGYAVYVDHEPWSSCPDSTVASRGDEPGAIEGSVVETGDLLVPRATVVVTGGRETRADVTDAGGRFLLEDLAPGNYTMTVYYGDVVFKKQCIRVYPGELVEHHVDLDVRIRTDQFFIVE
jgi:hypothetical protein